MKSSYKKIGDFITLVNNRNIDFEVNDLRGINIEKYFMPSVANTIGTDMSKYKIVKNGQFACNRMHVGRDGRLPIALWKGEHNIIVSPAYDVFEITDTENLDSDYLMMWFLRREFDRNAWFYTDADVRGGLKWEDFCNLQLPVPPITKQREIVKDYKVFEDRININNKIIQKLEETAESIYNHWFVNFEFPDKDGKPYKSSGGELVYSEDLNKEIPKGWKVGMLADIATITMGQSPSGESYNKNGEGMIFYQGSSDFGFRFPSVSTFTTSPKRTSKKGDILLSVRAPVGDINIAIEDCCIGRGLASLKSNYECNSHLFYLLKTFKRQFNAKNKEGTVFGSLTKGNLRELSIVYSESLIREFEKLVSPIDRQIKIYSIQNNNITSLMRLLNSKMSN